LAAALAAWFIQSTIGNRKSAILFTRIPTIVVM
jgi:hypothetical protein